MIKKLTLLAMALGALVAFAVPAVASAEAIVTNEKEEAVSEVTATNDPADPLVTQVTGGGPLVCEEIDITIALSENTTTTAQGSGAGAASKCTLNGAPAGGVNITVNSIDLNSTGGGSATFSFTYAGGACSFSGTIPLSYVTNTNTVSLVAGEGTNLKGSAGCFPSARITGSLILDEAVIM